MSRLRIYNEDQPEQAIDVLTDHAAITARLAGIGVRFEQWATPHALQPGASQDEVIAAYRGDIDRLCVSEGYQAVDVVSLKPDHPDRAAFREKFLDEHTHSEDEVRFFVAGAGQFTLHVQHKVYEVLCEQGDLISVPDGTRHWFDMSESPYFVAIRLFSNPEGWVASFTGEPIAARFPRMPVHRSARLLLP